MKAKWAGQMGAEVEEGSRQVGGAIVDEDGGAVGDDACWGGDAVVEEPAFEFIFGVAVAETILGGLGEVVFGVIVGHDEVVDARPTVDFVS